MKNLKFTLLLVVGLVFSVGLIAQRGRNNHKHRYATSHYQPRYNNQVSVRISPRYSYAPVYNPYYRYRPVYRPVVSVGFRTPGAYVHFGPVFGHRINALPYGYNSVYVGPQQYYYNQGVYYRPYSGGGYEVVQPPLNATVKNLPANAVVTVIDGQKYYQVGGTFYQEEFTENNKLRYRVVGTDGVLNTNDDEDMEDMGAYSEPIPPLGSRYNELPDESKVMVINQKKYFVAPNGIYYREVIEGNSIRYEVTTVD